MNHEVFISYKSQDIAIAKAIAHILEDINIHCWYAPRNLDKRSAGEDFDDNIVKAIKFAKVVIVLLCDESLDSKWVKREVNCADDNQKLIIPFVIREISKDKDNGLYYRLQTAHQINAFPSPNKKFDLLQSNVSTVLNHEAGETRVIHTSKNQIDIYDMDFDEGEALYAAKEYVDAIRSYLQSAENGNAKAKSRLCEIFFEILEVNELLPKDLWDSIEKLAKGGHAYANFLMHTKYYREPDSGLISFEYLKKSLSEGPLAEAFLRIGTHYTFGMGVNPNHILALHYYQKALDMGKTEAYGFLGSEHEFGNDKVAKDMDKAIEYYELGVEAKDKRSMMQLCNIYATFGIYQDVDRAKAIAQTAIDYGHDEGYVWMGHIHNHYLDDKATAKKWYIMASKKDIKGACTALANIYWEEGEKEIAFQWAHKGVANKDNASYTTLGWFYENTGEQYAEAWKYYKLQFGIFGAGAAYLGRLYLERGYRPAAEEKYKLDDLVFALEVCARNSNEPSIDYLVGIYSDPKQYGLDIEPDPQKAKEYELLGARLGHTKYIYTVGVRCLDKDDIKNYNPFKGIEWLEKSASMHHRESIIKLLEVYGEGGIEPDPELYDKWCDYAIVNNLAAPNCNIFLDFIEKCIANNGEYKAHYTVYLIYSQEPIYFENQECSGPDNTERILKMLEKGKELENIMYSKIIGRPSIDSVLPEDIVTE